MLRLAVICIAAVGSLALPSEKNIRLPMTRMVSNTAKPGELTSDRLHSLYWATQVTVGDSQNLSLVVDSGSTDVILDPKFYKPSKYNKPYPGKGTFGGGFEGINRAGYGFVNLTGTLQYDVVSAAGFSYTHQAVGTIKSYNLSDTRHLPEPLPGQGVLGFSGKLGSQFTPQAPSWLDNLAKQGSIASNRFGLAFGTSGKGEIVLGTFDESLTATPLYNTEQLDPNSFYVVAGDVYLNGEKVLKNQTFIMDVGTTNIQAPIGQAKSIFKKLGYQTSSKFIKNIAVKIISAYFPCDKPPTLGFSFYPAPGQKGSTIFNVSSAVWGVYNHGHNNCTSVLGGTNSTSTTKEAVWLVGQSFFDGLYVDFNNAANTMGFAQLKNPTMD